MNQKNLYFITGATGQLGRLVVQQLAQAVGADRVVAGARSPKKAQDLGVEVRAFDYSEAQTLAPALAGIDKVLLISSSEIGSRAAQHKAVIQAAKDAGVSQIVYTSVLRATDSVLGLAQEHRETEQALAESGLDYIVLRNGWYTENLTGSVAAYLNFQVVAGSSGEGRFSSAPRSDYAAAAVVALTQGVGERRIVELAGDTSFTKAELAAELSRLSGQEIRHLDLTQEAYRDQLLAAGLPAPVAELLADSDAAASVGALQHDQRELSALLGRPTEDWKQTLAAAYGEVVAIAS